MAELKQKITPCLWFDMNCEEAVNFYVDIFNTNPNKKSDSKIIIKDLEEAYEGHA